MFSKVHQDLFSEYNNLPVFYCIFYVLGILIYFCLPFEPKIFPIFITSFILISLIITGKLESWKALYKLSLCLVIGILIGAQRNFSLSPVAIQKNVTSKVSGKVLAIKPKEFGVQITLSSLKIEALKPNQTPTAIRFNIRDKESNILVGDVISGSLLLMPPPGAIIPGGYNFHLQAYFSKIGAVGYNVSEIKVIKRGGGNFYANLQNFRKKVLLKLTSILGEDIGNFAGALMVGEYSGINYEILQSIRASGISHILCVSGMHMSLVVIICFLSLRFLLNLSDYLYFTFDIKKISALGAILGSLVYLFISGMQVAALRAFIMSTFYMISILIDRVVSPLRSVLFAGIIILTLSPEQIIQPSFILSFSAVLSLVKSSAFDIYELPRRKNRNILMILVQYVKLNIKSTILASIATAPFSIYFFYKYPNYSLIANLAAVPITSFILMPLVSLSFFLWPFPGISEYIIGLMYYPIQIIIQICNSLVSLPYNTAYIGFVAPEAVILFAIAFLFYVSTTTSLVIRRSSYLLAIVSLILYVISPKPVAVVSNKPLGFAYKDQDSLLVSTKNIKGFRAEYWAVFFGAKEIEYLKRNSSFETKKISIYQNNPKCDSELVVNLSSKKLENCLKRIVNRKSLDPYKNLLIMCSFWHCHIKTDQMTRFNFR